MQWAGPEAHVAYSLGAEYAPPIRLMSYRDAFLLQTAAYRELPSGGKK
jgi:hypothetical protein